MAKTINCIIVDDEPVAREILENYLSMIDHVNIVANCKNALEAFSAINSKTIDLVFLDINMPEIGGLSFAQSINNDIKIIFTTAYREYAVEGFNLQAVDYLLKPVSFDRLVQAINKYSNENIKITAHRSLEIPLEKNDFFFVRTDRKMAKITFCDIIYIESLSDYIKIQLSDKTVVTRETITNIEAKLPQNDFIRTHRSFIVAKQKIESYTNEFIEIGSKQIPISRSYKDRVLNSLKN